MQMWTTVLSKVPLLLKQTTRSTKFFRHIIIIIIIINIVPDHTMWKDFCFLNDGTGFVLELSIKQNIVRFLWLKFLYCQVKMHILSLLTSSCEQSTVTTNQFNKSEISGAFTKTRKYYFLYVITILISLNQSICTYVGGIECCWM